MGRFAGSVLIGSLLIGWVLLVFVAPGSIAAEDAPERPVSALIVFDQAGKTTAIRVEGERQLAILENYFPGYRNRPESDEAGAWETRYEVYFNFKHGQTLRVLVSTNSRYWSMGRGDIEMRGYFADYVTALIKGNARKLPERE